MFLVFGFLSLLFGNVFITNVMVGFIFGLPVGSLLGVISYKKSILKEKINVSHLILGLVLGFLLTIGLFFLTAIILDKTNGSGYILVVSFLIILSFNVFLHDIVEILYKKKKRQVQ
jgi:hypothetical protein